MASYMPQRLFDMCVVTAVKIHMATGKSLEQTNMQVLEHYSHSFPDDSHLENHIELASEAVLETMRTLFTDKQIPYVMTQMQYCIKKYHPDGKKRRKRLLSGTMFTRSRFPNSNRVDDCINNITAYHVGTLCGVFPLMPDGWSVQK